MVDESDGQMERVWSYGRQGQKYDGSGNAKVGNYCIVFTIWKIGISHFNECKDQYWSRYLDWIYCGFGDISYPDIRGEVI